MTFHYRWFNSILATIIISLCVITS